MKSINYDETKYKLVPFEPTDARELIRRLYVELFHVNQQLCSVLDDDGEPIAYTGSTVRDVLADAKAMLNAAPAAEAPQQPATHGEPVASEKLLANLRALADVLYRGGNTRISDGELVLEAVGVLSALYTQPTPAHIKAMQQALEALNEVTGWQWAGPMRVMDEVQDAITALQNALKGTTNGA